MEEHQNILCDKCGCPDFDYDSSWKEYSCKNCGWVVENAAKISTIKKTSKGKDEGFDKALNKEEFSHAQAPTWYEQTQKATEFYSDFRKSLMGKRDGWTWFYGIVTPLIVISFAIYEIVTVANSSVPKRVLEAFYLYEAFVIVIVSVVFLSFFFKKLWARKAVYAAPFVISFLFFLIMHNIFEEDAIIKVTSQTIGRSIIPLIVFYFATQSIGNRAFFSLPINDKEIRNYWLLHSNKQARLAAILSIFLSLMICAFLILANSILALSYQLPYGSWSL